MLNNTDNLGSTAQLPMGRLNREKRQQGDELTPNSWKGENVKEENPNKKLVGMTGRRKTQTWERRK